MNRILVVDDDRFLLKVLQRMLSEAGYVAEVFDNPITALEYAMNHPIDAAIVDYHMPEMDGVTFLRALSKHLPDVAAVVLSGTHDPDAVRASCDLTNVHRFLLKPADEQELLVTLAHALSNRKMAQQS